MSSSSHSRDEPTTSKRKRKIPICPVEDFPPGTRKEVRTGNTTIAVFNIDGEYHAIYGHCPHQFAPLSRGKLQGTVICSEETEWETRWVHEGEVLVCPGHAMEFHVKSGEAFGYQLKLRTYEVIVENEQVKVLI